MSAHVQCDPRGSTSIHASCVTMRIRTPVVQWLIQIMTGQVPNRARLKFPGTTAGDLIGPVVMPELSSCWHETFREKRKIFGSARIAVGSKCSEDDVPVVKAKREDSTSEPVFFHSHGEQLHEELLHGIAVNYTSISGIVDFTPGDGGLAHVAIVRKIPYLGFVFTERHAEGLQKHLTRLIWADFQREDSSLYQSGLVGILEGLGEDGEEPEEAEEQKSKKKATAKAKTNANSKGKAAAKADPALSKALKKKIAKGKKQAEDAADDELDPEEEPDDEDEEEPVDSASE
jgi:hypothetical protein